MAETSTPKPKKKMRRSGALTHEEAFAHYVAMPPTTRSYTALAETYVARKYYDTVGTARAVIGRWAREHGWQNRIKAAATERATRLLQEAAEIDADTFHKTSLRLNEAVSAPGHIHPADVTRIRESVRKAEPKTTTTVDVNHSGTIKHAHHDMSAFTDEEIDTLAEIAERQKAEATS